MIRASEGPEFLLYFSRPGSKTGSRVCRDSGELQSLPAYTQSRGAGFSDQEAMRLFVAIPLPEDLAARIQTICHGLPDVRWVSPECMHLTLRFLGDDISPERFEEIADALASVQSPGFSLRVRGVGRFLHPRAPQVLWLGVDEEPGLRELHRRVEQRLRSVGFASEKRSYEPHITLARLKGVSDHRVLEYLQLHANFEAGAFDVDEFVLYSSVLRPGGAQHEIEEIFPLEPAAVESISDWAKDSKNDVVGEATNGQASYSPARPLRDQSA